MSLVREQQVSWLGPGQVHATTADMRLAADGGGAATCPRDLLLTSIAGCFAVALPVTLTRMRITTTDLRVLARGTLAPAHIGAPFETIEVIATLQADAETGRLERAARIAFGRACPVARMLSAACTLTMVVHHGDQTVGPFSWEECSNSSR